MLFLYAYYYLVVPVVFWGIRLFRGKPAAERWAKNATNPMP
jgi:hypothetical protein